MYKSHPNSESEEMETNEEIIENLIIKNWKFPNECISKHKLGVRKAKNKNWMNYASNFPNGTESSFPSSHFPSL